MIVQGADEVGTLANHRVDRAALVDSLINTHGGGVVKTMGDGLFPEFPATVNAAQCAIDIQLRMVKLNRDVPKDVRVRCRGGVNLDEAIFDSNGDSLGRGRLCRGASGNSGRAR